jgi:hypothetical protein
MVRAESKRAEGSLFAAQISQKAGLHDLWRVLIDIQSHEQNRPPSTTVIVAAHRINAATFLLEVAQCIAVASPHSPNVVLNLKTQLGRYVPIKPSCEGSLSGNPRMTAFTAGPRTATRRDSFSSPSPRDDAWLRWVEKLVSPFVVVVFGTTRTPNELVTALPLARPESCSLPRPRSRLLLGPHSQTTAFESRG